MYGPFQMEHKAAARTIAPKGRNDRFTALILPYTSLILYPCKGGKPNTTSIAIQLCAGSFSFMKSISIEFEMQAKDWKETLVSSPARTPS
jgi:hypothetical protein